MAASSDSPSSTPRPSGTVQSPRLAAVDLLRGFVIVLMAVDHSSGAFNRGRVFSDSAYMYTPGTALPEAQFFTRWITHLCAPTFVFLAGTSLALSVSRQRARGVPESKIDAHLVTRGLIIVALELWPSLFWMDLGVVLFQVLYAIGASFVLMAPIRRLPVPAIAALAVAIVLFGEAVSNALALGPTPPTPFVANLLLAFGRRDHLVVAYPALPWLAMMMLGWVFGTWLDSRPPLRRIRSLLAASGTALLAVFAALRGLNGYGNMHLLRDDGSLVQWLHVSKYPPSATYTTLELGIAALLLAATFGAVGVRAASPWNPLLVFGRTPMFFYLLHIPLLHLLAHGLGAAHDLGLGATYGFALVVALLLYPACLLYGRYKALHTDGWTRYL
jgi:uncharacterized membrane protein